MIYKFVSAADNHSTTLEVSRFRENTALMMFDPTLKEHILISLNKEQLYKLIGALHEIQKDIKKEGVK